MKAVSAGASAVYRLLLQHGGNDLPDGRRRLLARSIEWYWVYACIGLVYVAIFVLTFGCEFPVLGKKAQQESQPVVKENGASACCSSPSRRCATSSVSWALSPGYRNMPKPGHEPGDAGKLVSDFWMSYMIGMWSFSFILRFFDLQRILTVLAGLATVLMYLFINGSPEHMPWFILTLGFFSSAIYTSIITLGSQQTKVVAEAGELYSDLRHHRHHADFRGHRPDCGRQRSAGSAAHR
jgi:TsgA-like MFS transporter